MVTGLVGLFFRHKNSTIILFTKNKSKFAHYEELF